MSIKYLMEISKPILHEVESEEFPYSGVGTCFLAKYKNYGFLITAKHVIDGREAESLMIFPNKESKNSIPFNLFVNISNVSHFDSDYGDITVLRIDYSKLDITANSVMNVLDLDKYNGSWKNFISNGKMVFFGYPTENREVDYDNFIVKSIQKLVTGHYLQQSTSLYCHEIHIDDFGTIESLDGFSGSPVFILEKLGESTQKPHFCGMLIRGTIKSKKAFFIESEVIYNLVKKI